MQKVCKLDVFSLDLLQQGVRTGKRGRVAGREEQGAKRKAQGTEREARLWVNCTGSTEAFVPIERESGPCIDNAPLQAVIFRCF